MCQVQLSYTYNNGSHHNFIQPAVAYWIHGGKVQRLRKFCVLSELLAFQESGLNHDQLLQQSHYIHFYMLHSTVLRVPSRPRTNNFCYTFFFLPSLFFPFLQLHQLVLALEPFVEDGFVIYRSIEIDRQGEYESVAKKVGDSFRTCPPFSFFQVLNHKGGRKQ